MTSAIFLFNRIFLGIVTIFYQYPFYPCQRADLFLSFDIPFLCRGLMYREEPVHGITRYSPLKPAVHAPARSSSLRTDTSILSILLRWIPVSLLTALSYSEYGRSSHHLLSAPDALSTSPHCLFFPSGLCTQLKNRPCF